MRCNTFALFLLVLGLHSAWAQTTPPPFPFTYYIHDTTGQVADTPLPYNYQFNATPEGSSSTIVLIVRNTSSAAAFMGDVFVSTAPGTTLQNTNFTVTGLTNDYPLPAGGSLTFSVNFTPNTTGPITAYLETIYQVQQNGCDFTSEVAADQCPGGMNFSATLSGTATAPQLVLSYLAAGVSTTLQPSSTPLNFGNISTSGSTTITFTLANESNLSISVPAISVPPPTVYSASPYLLNASQMPATLAPGASANFTVTFQPGQTGVDTASLIVGSNTYPLIGAGVVIADVDALQISYVDDTGVRTLPQAATPISFGQIVAGTGGNDVLVFTVTNPSTSYNSITIPSLSVTGAGYTISAINGATAFPAALAPGASLGFSITFTPGVSGSYAGSLAIGTRVFALSGVSINSPLPALSLVVTPWPLTSQQQASVEVKLASASALNLIGTITMSFVPSVSGVSDDPAVMFMAISGRELPISIASGGTSATYKGQSALTFQSGTTAGTITFTVQFPNTAAYKQTYTITPTVPVITSATAVTSNPNLVVTLNGYDNTYSAGPLNFTFYDTKGNAITPIAVNAAGAFQNLFFGSANTGGGAFSLQATFPVTGDVTQIGSVAVTLNNSVGQASTTQSF